MDVVFNIIFYIYNIRPFNLSNADLYIIILRSRIIEYNKGNLSVFATLKSNSCLITFKDADPLGWCLECKKV
jgi:hypothetical protein